MRPYLPSPLTHRGRDGKGGVGLALILDPQLCAPARSSTWVCPLDEVSAVELGFPHEALRRLASRDSAASGAGSSPHSGASDAGSAPTLVLGLKRCSLG